MPYVKNWNRKAQKESMIEKWEQYTGKNCPTYCSNANCDNKLDDDNKCGSHVYKCDKDGKLKSKTIYIVPLCKECNNTHNEDVMIIRNDYLQARNCRFYICPLRLNYPRLCKDEGFLGAEPLIYSSSISASGRPVINKISEIG